MASIELIFVSVKNEVINFTIPEGKDTYDVKTAKEYIMQKMEYDSTKTEIKIIHKGVILKDIENLNNAKYNKDKLVFIKMTKTKTPISAPVENKEPTLENKITPENKIVSESKVIQESKDLPRPAEENKSEQKTDLFSANSVLNSILMSTLSGIFSTPETYLQILATDPVYQNLLLQDNTAHDRLTKAEFIKKLCSELSKMTKIKFIVETETSSTAISGSTINEIPNIEYIEVDDSFNTWLRNQTGEHRTLLNSFTKEQQNDIMNINIMGYNLYDIIELYPLSGFNISATIDLLNNN